MAPIFPVLWYIIQNCIPIHEIRFKVHAVPSLEKNWARISASFGIEAIPYSWYTNNTHTYYFTSSA